VLNARGEKVGATIRDAQLRRIPFSEVLERCQQLAGDAKPSEQKHCLEELAGALGVKVGRLVEEAGGVMLPGSADNDHHVKGECE